MTGDRKTAFITGSGRRLGRQIALGFAERGYNIVLHANSSAEGMHEAAATIRALGREVLETTADVANIDDVMRLVKEVSAAVPRLDVLINNAGILPECNFEDIDPALWDETMNINVRSMFFLTQQLAPLLKQSTGCVINFASEGGYKVWLKHIPYNVSKAAVIHLTRALAKQLAPDVRVNAIAPGLIIVPEEETQNHPPSDRIPLKRYGTPEDITASAIFLAETATYLTGHILPVDGGVIGAI